MKAEELRSKSVDELRASLLELLKEQFNLRMQRGAGQLTKHHLMHNVRKNIARVKTVMNEKSEAKS